EDPALAEADVAPLPGADEHHPVHDHHCGEDHRREPQVHAAHLACVLVVLLWLLRVLLIVLSVGIVPSIHRRAPPCTSRRRFRSCRAPSEARGRSYGSCSNPSWAAGTLDATSRFWYSQPGNAGRRYFVG